MKVGERNGRRKISLAQGRLSGVLASGVLNDPLCWWEDLIFEVPKGLCLNQLDGMFPLR